MISPHTIAANPYKITLNALRFDTPKHLNTSSFISLLQPTATPIPENQSYAAEGVSNLK